MNSQINVQASGFGAERAKMDLMEGNCTSQRERAKILLVIEFVALQPLRHKGYEQLNCTAVVKRP